MSQEINKIVAGRYQLIRRIGQGGMADVYEAKDTILNRIVAIKIMRSSLTGDPVYVTRFHREASAAASLSHKNIVEIYDVGEDEEDYYIVMEYVPGQTLKELIHKRGALHYVEAIDIMKQVVSATEKAHSLGIVHRDLKPQNIMVTDSGVVKIGDFGIASIQSLSQVTQTDTIMGSLHYLAPEIARGEKATNQSDLYALGIVFYELLRGEVPFNGESPVNIALKHMRDEIPSVRSYNSSIPQSIENIIIKAVAKNTKDRYQNAHEMLNDLLTYKEREHEEKLVFEYVEEEVGSTIVAEEKDFFTKTHEVKEDTEENKDKKQIDKKKIGIIAGIVALSIGIIACVYFLLLKPVKNFRMIDVVGFPQEEAVKMIEDNELVVDDNIIFELSDEYDEGIVINTNPTVNEPVRSGTHITLTVSSGKYIVVNDYVGMQYKDVEQVLIDYGFIVKKVIETSDEPANKILNQSIGDGTKFDPKDVINKTITLTVSKGYSRTVPNLYGQSVENAKRILEEAGFIVKTEVLTSPTSPYEIQTMKTNIVMKQSIEAFKEITKKGTVITIYYYDHIPELPNENEPENNNE